MWSLLPHSPSPPNLLASCEISDIQTKPYHMLQTLLLSTTGTGRNCRPTGHKFQPQEYRYTIHSTDISLAPFEFFGRIFGQWLPIRKSPIPLYLSLIYISTYSEKLPPHSKFSKSFLYSIYCTLFIQLFLFLVLISLQKGCKLKNYKEKCCVGKAGGSESTRIQIRNIGPNVSRI